jgi:hypothetical protein
MALRGVGISKAGLEFCAASQQSGGHDFRRFAFRVVAPTTGIETAPRIDASLSRIASSMRNFSAIGREASSRRSARLLSRIF